MATGGGYVSGRKHKHVSDSVDSFDFVCCVCAKENKRQEAQHYCVQCQDYFCRKCIKLHNVMPTLSGHVFVGKSDFSSIGKESKLPAVPTERCVDHPTKLVDMYCENHDKVCCGACMLLGHKSCKVLYIPDNIDKLFTPGYRKQVQARTKAVVQQLKETIKSDEDGKSKRNALRSNAIQEMKSFRQEVLNNLDKLEEINLNEINSICEELDSATDNRKIKLSKNLGLTERFDKRLDDVEDHNNVQQYVCLKLADDNAAQSEVALGNQTGGNVESITFQPDSSILQSLRSYKSLGKVSVLKSKTGPFETKPTKKMSQTRDRRVYSKDKLVSSDIKVKGESEWYLNGVCILGNGNVIVADRANSRLKRLTPKGSSLLLANYLDLPDEPWSVCAINQGEVAVTIPEQQLVQIVSISDSMKVERSIKVNYKGYAIVHHDKELYVSDYNRCVYVYNMSGTPLREIRPAEGVLHDIRNIAVSETGRVVYVADYINGLIAVDSKNGTVVWKYKGELDTAYGVCVDAHGSVFVCGYVSDNVLQISESGDKVAELLTKSDGLYRPWSLCYDDSGCRLFIAQSNGTMAILTMKL